MPKISVVMPYYRGREYLEQAIASIQNQSMQDWELLVVAEQGHDAQDLLEKLSQNDNRIRVLLNPGPRGISASLNYGMANSRGEYIARMDADDICEPHRFQAQVDYLEAHPEVLLCGSRTAEFGESTTGWQLEYRTEQLTTDILFYSPCVHPAVMFRRSVFEEHGIRYREDFRATEDYAFFADVLRYGKIANIDEVLLRYRVTKTNATHTQAQEGIQLYLQVMDEQLQRLGLFFSRDELELLCVHIGPASKSGTQAVDALQTIDLLLKKILAANEEKQVFDRETLFRTLRKRFWEACDCLTWRRNLPPVRNAAREAWNRSIFRHEELYRSPFMTAPAPVISVILPAYNSENYIADTLWSLLLQRERRFEILLINEFGSGDNTATLAKMFRDPRIRIIQNPKKLGLTESLNAGIRMARGEYIARADADDLYPVDRFEKQLAYMEGHPECGVCGSWQHHFGKDKNWIHHTPESHEDIQASLIYNCDMCHSTLMLRRQMLLDHELFYDAAYAAEDYELWTRAVMLVQFHNLPEVLGEYRWDGQNITQAKQDILSREAAELVARNLKQNLGITVPAEHVPYLNGWSNAFVANAARGYAAYKKALMAECDLLYQIWQANLERNAYQPEALLTVLSCRWRWCLGFGQHGNQTKLASSIDALLAHGRGIWLGYAWMHLKRILKALLRRLK